MSFLSSIGASDVSGTDVSGVDASGVDASGVSSNLFSFSSSTDASGTDQSGAQQQAIETGKGLMKMLVAALVAGIGIIIFFVSSQSLVYLTKPEQIKKIPVSLKKPPYAPGVVEGGQKLTKMQKLLYSYGAPYSWKDDSTVLPFIPCNFMWARTFLNIKPWMALTIMHSWSHGRSALKGVLSGIGGLPNFIKMPFALLIILLVTAPTPLVSWVFTLMSSFKTSVLWSILGILCGVLPLLMLIVGFLQTNVLFGYLLFSPLMTKPGKAFIFEQVQKYKWYLRLLYMITLIILAPICLSPLYAVGMILGVILVGI